MAEFFITAYVDGGARGNPGPAAAGVVFVEADGGKAFYREKLGEMTNNEAEYRSAILALKKLKQRLGQKKSKNYRVLVRMDSELASKQLRGEYKIRNENLKPLFIEIWNLKQDFAGVEFETIPREKNKEADKLVNDALNREEENLF